MPEADFFRLIMFHPWYQQLCLFLLLCVEYVVQGWIPEQNQDFGRKNEGAMNVK